MGECKLKNCVTIFSLKNLSVICLEFENKEIRSNQRKKDREKEIVVSGIASGHRRKKGSKSKG
jgi:hypothetical protein